MLRIGTKRTNWLIPKIVFLFFFFILLIVLLILAEKDRKTLYHIEENNSIFLPIFLILLIVFTILTPILILTDRTFRNSKILRFIGNYIKFGFSQAMKETSQEYEVKDAEHEDKLSELQHKQRMRDIEYLAPLAKINWDNAKTDIEKARAAIMRDAINYMYRMSDRWRAYIFSCVNGAGGTEPEDLDLKAQTEKIKKDIEYEKLRKEQIDNDDRERKARENL